jgi:hypothetical protein
VMGTWVSGKGMSHDQIPAKTGAESKEKMMMIGDGLVSTIGSRDPGKAVECAEMTRQPPVSELRHPVISTPSRVMPRFLKPGMERLKGRAESVGDGQPTLSVRLELLAIKRVLTSLRSEVEGGLERIESILGSLESNGPKLGLSERELMGSFGNQTRGLIGNEKAFLEVSFSQPTGPKPRKKKKKKKKQPM